MEQINETQMHGIYNSVVVINIHLEHKRLLL